MSVIDLNFSGWCLNNVCSTVKVFFSSESTFNVYKNSSIKLEEILKVLAKKGGILCDFYRKVLLLIVLFANCTDCVRRTPSS